MKKILFIIGLLAAANISAQQLIQSRFTEDRLSTLATCHDCVPNEDGIAQWRFDPDSVEVVTETINGNATKRLRLTIEIKATRASESMPLSYISGLLRVDYSSTAFGADLNDPVLFNRGRVNPNGKCGITRSALVTTDGSAAYTLRITGTDDDTITFSESGSALTLPQATADQVGFLTDEFKPFITLTCTIVDDSADAGFSFNGTNATGNQIRTNYPDPDDFDAPDAINRPIIIMANNDIRGFRLDGKTWAEDYARFGDGAGVRLKFSKGVAAYASGGSTAAALTAANFAVYDGAGAAVDSAISSVEHTANDPYVTIKLNSALAAGVINLVSTTTSVVRDVDGDDLADGNFVASLHYDSAASTATAIVQNKGFNGGANETEWTITFSSAIDPNTVTKDNICVTEANGVCMAEGTTATVPVISVKTEGTAPTTLTMVINEAEDARTGGDRSIEFRRNAVLGTDLRIVEDYQPALRDAIKFRDTIGAVIEVVAVNADGTPLTGNLVPTGGNYNIYFRITADEDVPSLGDGASYRFIGVGGSVTNAITQSSIDPIPDVSALRGAMLMIQISVGDNVDGFTLERSSSTALQDGAGNDPIRADGTVIAADARIDNDADAVATIDKTPPAITLENPTIIPSNNGRTYDVGFDVVSTEPVPTIGDSSSYVLLTTLISGALVSFTGATLSINPNDDNTSATVSVTGLQAASYSDVENIRSFTLGRASATALRDADDNVPVRGGGTNGTGAIGTGVSVAGRIDNDTAAERELNPPTITVPQASLTPSNAGLTYDIRFNVMANKPIPTIGMPGSYRLIHLTSGTAVSPNATVRANDDLTTATVSYKATFASNQYAAVRATTGFTLARANTDGALRDRFANQPNNRNSVLIARNRRIDPATDAVANRDMDGPPLTIATHTATPRPGNPNIFDVVFRITSTENVETLDSSDSYILRRFHGSGTNLFANNTVVNVTTPTAGGSNSNTDSTFTYAVTLSDAEIAVTGGFGLFRAASATALIDDSGNAPVKSNGTTAIAPSVEIGTSAERAIRETDGANLTVQVVDQVPADDNVEASPMIGNGNIYLVSFIVTNVDHATKPIATLGVQTSYRMLYKRIINDTLVTADADFDLTIRDNGASVLISASIDQFSQTNSEMTEGFILGLGTGGLLDSNGNPPRLNNVTITAGAIDPSIIARRDTTPPRINVLGITVTPDGTIENAYDITFQTTSSEIVQGAETTASYSLLRIVNEDDTPTPFAAPPVAASVTTATSGIVTIAFENVPITTLPHGFTLGRSGTSLRDLSNNDPVDHADTDNRVDNNQALDSDAIGVSDNEGPRITVEAVGGMVPTSTPRQYQATFRVTANETVQDIGNHFSYLLIRIDNNDARTEVDTVSMARISGDTGNGDEVTLRITADQFSNLADVRATKGFTLGLRGGGVRLQDLADNLPVKSDGSAIYDTDGTTRLNLGVLAPITGGVVDVTAVALRDTTPPTLTLAAGDLTATADLTFTGSFTVSARETIENIGVATSYELLRSPISGNDVVITTSLTPSSVTTGSAVISFSGVTLADAAQARGTDGFILRVASGADLRDRSGNSVTGISDTAEVEKESPQITITTNSSNIIGDAGRYAISFTVASNEPVSTLDVADSYQLVRVIDNAGNADTTMLVPAGNIAGTSLIGNDSSVIGVYIVTGISPEILHDTEGFTLIRAAGANGALIDRSGNMPVKSDGGNSIVAGGVISFIASREIRTIATLESTQPQITVEAIGMADPMSDNINQYTVRFRVESTEAIPDIDDPASYVVLRIPTGGGTPSPTTSTIMGTPEINSAGRITTLTYVVSTSGLSQTAATAGFTLGRGGTSSDCHLCDYAGNLPAHGGTTIAAGARIDDDAAAVAERDTSQPEITVVAVGY